jgi:hypothetical protein
MPNNSDRRRKKIAPLLCAGGAILVLGVYLGALLLPQLAEVGGHFLAAAFLVLYALVVLAMIGGVIAALVQRLREIERGEEEDARKY